MPTEVKVSGACYKSILINNNPYLFKLTCMVELTMLMKNRNSFGYGE